MWARWGAVAFAFALSTANASAQMTEQQKRKALLPTIRAATDCIAREAARHQNIVQGYRLNNLAPMVSEGWRACTAALGQVVVMHDGLHGNGTGIVFVKGPYSDDLIRAVRVRLQPELDRRVAALDRAEAEARAEQDRRDLERQQTLQRLEQAAATLRDRAYSCTTPQVEKLVASAETAEVLATAAMTICRREIGDAIEARIEIGRLKFGTGYRAADQTTDREGMQKVIRDNVVTIAVQLKAGAAARPPASPSLPVSTPPDPPATPQAAAGADLPKAVRDCLATLASARNGKFIDQRGLYEAMLELCRPEIEAAARNAFLAKEDGDLANEREVALSAASSAAKAMVGMVN